MVVETEDLTQFFHAKLGALYGPVFLCMPLSQCDVSRVYVAGYYQFKFIRPGSIWNFERRPIELLIPETMWRRTGV